MSGTQKFNCFADWCKNKDSLSEEASYTVEVLLQYAKTDDCDRAEEVLSNLTELNLSAHLLIKDLRPLQTLTNLISLDIRGNKISDITPLNTLKKLTSLHLEDNEILDISPLQGLINLTQIYLSNHDSFSRIKSNEIRDISPLKNLTNLTILELSGNPIIDIDLSPLQTLTSLTRLDLGNDLVIDTNKVIDLSPLKTLTSLTWLNLHGNKIIDLSSLKTLTNLTWLDLGGNEIIDLMPLQFLKNLTQLELPRNQISNVSPLRVLTNLTYLDLEDNHISDLTPLQILANLTKLFLGNNLISDVSPLANLTNLTELQLFENRISDLSPLQNLTNLTKLYFPFDNPIHAEGKPALELSSGYKLYAYHGVFLPEEYGAVHPSQWQPQWILEETNAELRRVLIQGIGYARICQELAATELDSWREYTLLRIEADLDLLEPVHLLKMNCPSTRYIHVLRIPPDITSAREAISWVNWDIDPEDFSIET
jgi:internalin A